MKGNQVFLLDVKNMETKEIVKSEIENRAKFNIIRYAQVWEDAEILISGLDINEKDNILSIGSAGENAFAMLIKNPNKIYALDLNINQIMCIKFKICCYKHLEYQECMELMGVIESSRREEIFLSIKDKLEVDILSYFEENYELVKTGIIHMGKLENYFKLFREKILKLVHSAKTIDELWVEKTMEEREEFYNKKWNNLRWKMLFRIFFSRTVMGKLGRDKEFFKYVEVNVAENMLKRMRYALTTLDPANNSYLEYMFRGKYENALCVAYRKENFEVIKKNIDKVEVRMQTIETFLETEDGLGITKYNLSDIFEYMSEDEMCKICGKIIEKSENGSKIAYWNMLSDRRASKTMDKLKYHEQLSNELFLKDKAFFYSKYIVEEVQKGSDK